ncbi:hypothetical protein IWW37_003243 [Coemansia sp. RSA 2050]|nr:hypothetical protein IWW37_003243 [Coemansia sp. RSA 2050]
MALFAVSHQLVSLDIDFSRRLVKGVTELSIKPKTGDLTEIRLHCDRPVVRSVTVNGLVCDFARAGPTTRQQVLDKISRTQDKDEGELVVKFPSDFCVEENTSAGFKLAKVRIEFYLVNAKTALVFGGVSESDDGRPTTVHTETRMYPSVTRSWLPCVDTMHERSTWDLFYTVPACVESAGKSLPMTVISVGELSSLVVHPRDPLRKVFRYVMSTATPACTLGFAVGPFTSACTLDSSLLAAGKSAISDTVVPPPVLLPPPPLDEERAERPHGSDNEKDEEEEEEEDEEVTVAPANTSIAISPETVDAIGGIYAFTYGGQQAELENTCSFLPEALGFHSQEFGAYPYTSFKIVFLEGLRTPVTTCASLALVSVELLHPATVIEAAYEARRVIGLGIAQQWFGTFVAAADWADQWLVLGLAGYTAGAFVRHNLGHNEHRFRLKRDMARLCHADVNQRALSYAGQQWASDDVEFMRLKAPIVLHMLDRRMVKGGQSLGLARMVAKVLGACVSGDLGSAHAVTTAWFLRGCRRVSGVDVGSFSEQWIYGTGCPVFHMAYAFNRKKLAVEITVHQESTNAKATAPWAKPQVFRGPLTARIREADGTPYEHVLDIHERVRRFEVQFNTKYKRIRRSTKRFHQRQMAATDDAGAPAAALFGAETVQSKRAWRVVEWGEADEESLASATFEWIRVDPDLEWACVVHFDQPAFMWAAQLQRDRDVAAQADAVAALQRMPSAAASTALMRAVMDSRVFYRVRVAAALALAALATERLAWIGLHHLVNIYKARYCMPNGKDSEPLDEPRLPRPNDFSSVGEYFTQRAVLAALSNIRDRRGEAPAPARRLLLAALRYNDNSENPYADGHYLAGLAAATANSVAGSQRFITGGGCADAMAEVERLRALDLLVPSFHNVVTCAALEALVRVSLVQPHAHVFNTALFAAMADPQAYTPVRQTAVSGLLLHWGLRVPPVARLMAAWASDSEHPRMAVDVARHLVQLLMVRAMVLGRQHHSLMFMEEQGPSADEHIDTPARLVGGFEALVDDGIADSLELRCILASATYDSAVPAESRRLLSAVHALVYQTVDESMPPPPLQPRRRLKIRLQPKSVKPPEGSPMSSDSEDTPLGALLGVGAHQDLAPNVPKPKRKYQRKVPRPTDEQLVVDDDDDNDDVPLMLPPIAGTRPPPLAVPDASLNSPVYSAIPTSTPPPPPPPPPTPPIKLKLKLSKVASSAILDTISSPTTSSSPLAKEIIPGTLPPPPTPPPPAPVTPSAPATPAVAVRPAETTTVPLGIDGATRKLLHRVLRKLSRHPDAFPFMRPVDVVLDGCPTYYDVIKQPMDLGTVKRKLETPNGYATAEQFEADVRLMLANCFAFNPPGTPVHVMGQSVEKAFDAEWIKCGLSSTSHHGSTAVTEAVPSTPPVAPKATPKTVARISTSKRKSFQASPSAAAAHSAPSSSVVEALPEFESPNIKRIKTATTPTATSGAKPSALDSNDPDAIIEYLDQTTTTKKSTSLDWSSICARVLLRLQAQPSAIEFMAPVDPIKQGVPTYFDVIKRPIDLSTIRTKLLTRHAYGSATEFREDLELLFSNCYLFNTAGTYVHTQCETLQAIFEATWARLSNTPDLPMDDGAYERARSVLGKLKRDERCWPFLKPVDPVALGVPTYFDLVKNPMDMSTIQKKLSKKTYRHVAEFVADIQLIIDDCFLFNIKDTPVHDCGKALHSLATKLLEPDHWTRWLF